MSDKRARKMERSLRFRRRMRNEKAVSPVVATLILILIAVAAAAALYLWLVAWQGGVTKGIGSPAPQYTLTIGGSTSVYPFAVLAATQFEQNQSDVAVSVNQGGSGAGMAAVCTGQVDIGEASAFYTATTLETSYGCPSTVAIEIVAYDGVDPIVATSNPHFATQADVGSANTPNSLQWDTLQAVYIDASTTAAGNGGTTSANILAPGSFTMDGQVATAVPQPAQGTGFVWDQLPAFAAADFGNTYGGQLFGLATGTTGNAGALGTGQAPCTAPYANDLCSVDTDTTSCGFTICFGGTGAGAAAGQYMAPINVNYRSDVSGTSQSFISRDLAVAASGGTPLGLGFTGCGGDNQFDGCGLAFNSHISTGGEGNPAVIANTGGSKDAIGYASDGLVQSSSVVVPVNFEGYGQTVIVNIQGESTALKAIASGIADYNKGASTYGTDQAYVGWRPFLNVETAPPTGEALRYLQFVMDPANNENIAGEAAEISVYASGLAGVVPVTPVP